MKREYVIKLTDEEKEALRKSKVNGPLYHLVKQILEQNNNAGQPSGKAGDCKSLIVGSIPTSASMGWQLNGRAAAF